MATEAMRHVQPLGKWLWWLMGGVLALVILFAVIAGLQGRREVTAPASVTPAVQGASLREIINNPGAFTGKQVFVSGEVNRTLGLRAFTLGGEEFPGGGELLVVTAGPFPATPGRAEAARLATDDLVQIEGQVRPFALAEFEQEIGYDLDDRALSPWEGRPAVLAHELILTPRLQGGTQLR